MQHGRLVNGLGMKIAANYPGRRLIGNWVIPVDAADVVVDVDAAADADADADALQTAI